MRPPAWDSSAGPAQRASAQVKRSAFYFTSSDLWSSALSLGNGLLATAEADWLIGFWRENRIRVTQQRQRRHFPGAWPARYAQTAGDGMAGGIGKTDQVPHRETGRDLGFRL